MLLCGLHRLTHKRFFAPTCLSVCWPAEAGSKHVPENTWVH